MIHELRVIAWLVREAVGGLWGWIVREHDDA